MLNILQEINYNSLNSIDIVVLLIISLSVLFAFFRGFISSVMSLVGWIASIIVTYNFAPNAQLIIVKYIQNELLIIVVSYVALMVLSLIGFAILNSFVSTMLGFLRGGFFDKSLGALFGLFRGIIIVSFLFLSTIISSNLIVGNDIKELDEDSAPNIIKQAQTYKLLNMGSNVLINFIPDTFGTRIEDFANKVENTSLDERFIHSMTRKMSNYMTAEEISDIEQNTQELSLQQSEEQVERKTAHELLERYKQKKDNGEINGEINGEMISESDLERLDKVLKAK